VLEDVVRAEIRKAAVARHTALPSTQVGAIGEVKPAEKGLIWAFVHTPESALEALSEAGLELDDLEGLESSSVLRVALSLRDSSPRSIPDTLVERLSDEEADLVRQVSVIPLAPAPPAECVRALKRRRYERERAAVQQQIDRLQELGGDARDEQIDALWTRKIDLLHRIEALNT
jgi:hypothetical protein